MVGLESLDADLFESGEELADSAVVVDPALGVVGLVVGEVAADGLVGDLAGPVPVGAVQAWWVVVRHKVAASFSRRNSALLATYQARGEGGVVGYFAGGGAPGDLIAARFVVISSSRASRRS